MFGKHQTEALIVGAGPVGLFTALSLLERGVSVRIIDEAWRTAAHSYALVLHPHSLDLLAQLGLAESIIARGYRVDTMAFYEGGQRQAEVHLSSLPVRHPFALVLPQSELEGTMERALAARDVKVRWNHRLSQLEPDRDRMVATVDRWVKESGGYASATTEWVIDKTMEVTSSFVIGADGHRSMVRRMLGLEQPPVSRPELFAVFELETDFDAGHEARVGIDQGLMTVLWPLPNGRCRLAFQLPDTVNVRAERQKSRVSVQIGDRAFPLLTKDHLMELAAGRAPWFDGSVGQILWALIIEFEHRLVDRFGRGVVWLAGDAAHLACPVGAQSMNVGLREGQLLSERVSDILRHKTSIDQLLRYDHQQQQEWGQLLGLSGRITPAAETSGWVREHSRRLVPSLPASGQDLRGLLGQLGLSIDR